MKGKKEREGKRKGGEKRVSSLGAIRKNDLLIFDLGETITAFSIRQASGIKDKLILFISIVFFFIFL